MLACEELGNISTLFVDGSNEGMLGGLISFLKADGEMVGVASGLDDGEGLGLTMGKDVGKLLGFIVGAVVTCADGEDVGMKFGFMVAVTNDGDELGDRVVGLTVGSIDASSSSFMG